MLFKIYFKSVFLVLVIGLPGVIVANETEGSIEPRMQYIARLLNNSSGAIQVINSDNKQAKTLRLEALELYQQAKIKENRGENKQALDQLNQSVKVMFSAISMATPARMLDEKLKNDYSERKKSVIALQKAFHRIADENNDQKNKKLLDGQLAGLLGKAEQLFKLGDNIKARAEIDKAYHLLKVSIGSVREGQTLVRSLHFETKEEEYHYELDRNETHKMLLRMLSQEKVTSEYAKKMLNKYIHEAEELRKQADAVAKESKYEQAIELLEKSTKQLVRAIRSAGIYIPG